MNTSMAHITPECDLNRFLVLGNAPREILTVCSSVRCKPVLLTSQFFERLALRLRDKERCKEAEQPECQKGKHREYT